MSDDIFEKFSWHSSIGLDETLDGSKRFVTKLPLTAATKRHFTATAKGDNFLIHKTTKALWRMSEDKKSIQPLYPTDILSEDQAMEIMEEEIEE
jgi:threonyl-tRNA synthetase